MPTYVKIDLNRIVDQESFHDVFKETMGFPEFYGRNMSAWVDCMTNVDAPSRGLSSVTVEKGDVLVLELENAKSFKAAHPDLFADLIDESAFVNWRRMRGGRQPVLVLSYFN
jgi:RNAse (barnase) inhibitor barstar